MIHGREAPDGGWPTVGSDFECEASHRVGASLGLQGWWLWRAVCWALLAPNLHFHVCAAVCSLGRRLLVRPVGARKNFRRLISVAWVPSEVTGSSI